MMVAPIATARRAYNSGQGDPAANGFAKRQRRTVWDDPNQPRPQGQTQAVRLDPLEMVGGEEWAEILEATRAHTVYGNFALRQMAKAPWIACILQTMISKLVRFATPQTDPYSLGYKVAMMDFKRAPSEIEQKEGERLTKLLYTCGEFRDDNERFTRKYFPRFIREIVYDSLTLDAACFEVVDSDKRGKPALWQPVDAAQIFRVFPQNIYGEYDPEDAAFVQRMRQKDTAWYTAKQLCFGVRRTRTETALNGYGFPELVELLEIVTAMITAWSYNQKYFMQGGPKGALTIEGDISPDKFRAFNRQMAFQAAGIKNAFRTVVLQVPSGQPGSPQPGGLKYVPFGMPNKEMEFGQWVDANYKIACSLFGVDPGETKFYFPAAGVRSQMNESSPEAKLRHGEMTWLHPTLRELEQWLNTHIIWRLNPDFYVSFCGDDALSEMERAELAKAQISSTHTVDEVRAMQDLQPLPDGKGAYVDSPSYMQFSQAIDMQKQQEEMAARGGTGGAVDENGNPLPPDAGGQDPNAATGQPGAQAEASPDDWGEWGQDVGDQGQAPQPGPQAQVAKAIILDLEV